MSPVSPSSTKEERQTVLGTSLCQALPSGAAHHLAASPRAQPTKLMTTRWRMVLAKRKSANARSGEMPWNSPLFWGLIWIRRQTAQQRKNEPSVSTAASHGGKHSIPGQPSPGWVTAPPGRIYSSLTTEEQDAAREFDGAVMGSVLPQHHTHHGVPRVLRGRGSEQDWTHASVDIPVFSVGCVRMIWVGRDLRDHLIPIPRTPPLSQTAPSLIQPGPGHF